MKLTEVKCRNAKPLEKPYKLFDGRGLYLEIRKNGSKYWRMKYRFLGKEKLLAIGVYPEISLSLARQKCLDARRLLDDNIDPSAAKKEAKRVARQNSDHSFESVAREWHENIKAKWTERHANTVLKRLERDIFPFIGYMPVSEITPPQVLDCLKKVQKRGAIEPAHRMRQSCGQIFRYAIANGYAVYNPASELSEALNPMVRKHYPAISANELPELLSAIERNDACLRLETRLAVKLLMLTFVRTKELIEAKWTEFDLDNAEWVVPAERMKMRKEHIVPLSNQSLEILHQLREINGRWEWILPGQHSPRKHMSNNTIRLGLHRLGFKDRMTGHGFRALAMSTIKEKLNYRHEVIDRQLAHAAKSMVTRAYDRAQFLDERKVMMQDWADYLDHAAKGGTIITGNFANRKKA